MKLNELKQGNRATVMGVRGLATEKQRLAGMGLNIGFEVVVLEPPQGSGGALLVHVGGTRLVLANKVAETILVRER